MKKTLLILCTFILSLNYSRAQLVTIGTGSYNSVYGPILIASSSSINTNSWFMCIYNQSEMMANGANAGMINSLSWYKNSAGAYPTNDGSLEIYIKTTPLPNFGGGASSFAIESVGATLVYSSTTSGLSSTIGWIDYTLSTPFNWNGTDNIMVLAQWVRVGSGTAAVNWACDSALAVAHVSRSFSTSSTPGSFLTNKLRPNIKMNFVPLGIQTIGSKINFEVYPNPANDNVTIDLSKVGESCTIEIINAIGELMYAERTTQKSLVVNLNTFTKGIYTLKVQTAHQTETTKLAVTK